MRSRTWLTLLGVAASFAGLYLLYRVLSRYDPDEVLKALASVPWIKIAAAAALTVCAFLCLITLEYLAVLYARRKVPVRRIARTCVAALGIGHSLGISALSSGGVRYRMYSREGLKIKSIGEIVAFSGMSVALGLGLLGGFALFWYGDVIGELLGISPLAIQVGAVAGWGFILTYIVLCATLRRPLRLRSHEFRLPSVRVACAQVVLSATKYLLVAAILYTMISGFTQADYFSVAALYIGADASAVIAHVPGGWGLLEYILTSTLEGQVVISGILAFRAMYYLVPLFIGLSLFLHDEWGRRHGAGSAPTAPSGARRA